MTLTCVISPSSLDDLHLVSLSPSAGSPEGRSQEGGDLRSQCRRPHVRHGRQPREVRQLHEGCQVSVGHLDHGDRLLNVPSVTSVPLSCLR